MKLKLIIIVVSMIVYSCNSIKTINHKKPISKITFRHYYEVNKQGELSSKVMKDSILNMYRKEYKTDSLPNFILENTYIFRYA